MLKGIGTETDKEQQHHALGSAGRCRQPSGACTWDLHEGRDERSKMIFVPIRGGWEAGGHRERP